MFLLTNEQRKCFGLLPVEADWECITAKPSPYDHYTTLLWLKGDTVVKCVQTGGSWYSERELREQVSPDRSRLLPKTAKGKPVILSSSTVDKRTGTGMRLHFQGKNVFLYSEPAQCSYFSDEYTWEGSRDVGNFGRWVEKWCAETTEADAAEAAHLARQERRHVRFREGDVFRFKIDRRLYGYGRVLVDYAGMRRRKEPFWDVMMATPVVCSVYHTVTERADVSAEELRGLRSLPSCIIWDNPLYYGEYEILGNLPITEEEDYPILYGSSIRAGEDAVCWHCGKEYLRMEGAQELYYGFHNIGTATRLLFTLDVLRQCIEAGSNAPYWENYRQFGHTDRDLRNPKFADRLQKIRAQFGMAPLERQ